MVTSKKTFVHIFFFQNSRSWCHQQCSCILTCIFSWSKLPSQTCTTFISLAVKNMYFKGYELNLTLPIYGKCFLFPNRENCCFWLFKSKKNKTLSKKELILQSSPAFASCKHQKIFLKYFLSLHWLVRSTYHKHLVIAIKLHEHAFPEFKRVFGAYRVLGKRYCYNINDISQLKNLSLGCH